MKTTCLTLASAAILLASCKKSPTDTAESSSPASGPSSALAAVLEAKPNADAKAIHSIRESAKPGDVVTVSGRVMGNANPFVQGRAAFVLGDPEVLTACNENPDDACETPWDVCCDSPEDKKRGTATIQIVGEDGRVLKEGMEGVGGIAKLATLTVSGTVAEGSTPDMLMINANAIDIVE